MRATPVTLIRTLTLNFNIIHTILTKSDILMKKMKVKGIKNIFPAMSTTSVKRSFFFYKPPPVVRYVSKKQHKGTDVPQFNPS